VNSIFRENDIRQMSEQGISESQALKQLEILKRGIPPIRLLRPCTIGDGIANIEDVDKISRIFLDAEADGRVMKFVPASGAASRMFAPLIKLVNEYEQIDITIVEKRASNDGDHAELIKFINGIRDFPFYSDLQSILSQRGIDIGESIGRGQYKEIVEAVISESGLNYAELPKGLIKFHKYDNESRTAIEEHLVEAVAYCKDRNGTARIHFTISPEHEQLVKSHVESVLGKYTRDDVNFEISYSFQQPSTDTIAVDMQDNPFRLDDGSLLFRPGGHGALLENLNNLKGDIIIVKNVDNVVPDRLKGDTYRYKRALGGFLVRLQESLFHFLNKLTRNDTDGSNVDEAMEFARDELAVNIPDEIAKASINERKEYLISKFNRPIRVCGIVKNEGEPGGGPFWVEERDGAISRQIVEFAQVDLDDPNQEAIWKSATHFSPVDLVCGVRDFKGKRFDLMKFRDPDSGFITKKSQDGKKLKALELPGLWNGSMAYWTSLFVEVPVITFNPVKTVCDLLRPNHQPAV
jgi:hypothetical protein